MKTQSSSVKGDRMGTSEGFCSERGLLTKEFDCGRGGWPENKTVSGGAGRTTICADASTVIICELFVHYFVHYFVDYLCNIL